MRNSRRPRWARSSRGRQRDPVPKFAALVGATACVTTTVLLVSGQVAGGGSAAAGAAGFVLVTLWCATTRRVDRALAALALYLGLLDGYVKLSTGSTTVTLARDVLVVAIAAGALFRGSMSNARLSLPPLSGFVLAFCALVLVEIANPGARGLTASLAGVRQHLEFVPLFFLGYTCVRSESQVRTALLVLVFCAAVGGVVSYIQSTLTPEQLAAWGPGYAQRVLGTGLFTGSGRTAVVGNLNTVRPFGLGSDAGAGALAASLALPALVALAIGSRGHFRWALGAMSIGVGLAVASSGSRSALITVFTSLGAFGLVGAASKSARKTIVGIIVGAAVIYVAFVQLGANNASTQRANSVSPTNALGTFYRERGPSVALFPSLVTHHPVGAGLASAGPAARVEQTASSTANLLNAETQWNFLVVELGLAGVLIYVGLILRVVWLSITRIRRIANPAMRLYLAALSGPICGLLVAGFSGPTSASVPVAPFQWLVIGILAYWLVTAYRTLGSVASPADPDAPAPPVDELSVRANW